MIKTSNRISLLVILISIAIIGICVDRINTINDKNSRLQYNQSVLLDSIRNYKVADSLNAAKIGVLNLSIDDYKRHRAEDIKLIKDLQLKLSNINSATKVITKTEYKIKTQIKDSIVRDTVKLACFNYESKWADVIGCVDADTIQLDIKSREALRIFETIEHKRFLGFLWKTSKIKKHTIDIISDNPNTNIVGVEHIKIVK